MFLKYFSFLIMANQFTIIISIDDDDVENYFDYNSNSILDFNVKTI